MKLSNLLLPLVIAFSFTISASAQQVDSRDLNFCVSYAINYALFVAVAHNIKDEKTFQAFVDAQIAGQPDQSDSKIIRHMAEEAWREKDIPPTLAGMDVFNQCERALIKQSMPQRSTEPTI